MPTRSDDTHLFTNTVQFLNAVLQAGAISDAQVNAAAAISASKLQHQYVRSHAQPNTTATTETRTLHVVYGTTGTILAFRAGSIGANSGAATVTVDLKKNGSSVLSSVITLNSSSTARTGYDATISNTALAAGDWLEVVITATAGGGTLGTGVFCELVHTEYAA